MTTQPELPFLPVDVSDLPHAEQFTLWVKREGGNWCLQKLYALASGRFAHFLANGKRCGIRLLWELVRWDHLIPLMDQHPELRKRTFGYALNNNFHAHVVRHMIAHHPEWAPMFETRESEAD